MKVAATLLVLALVATPSIASRGGHHGLFGGGGHHGHSINAWMGNPHPKLR